VKISVAAEAGKHYDVEMDRAAAANGKLDTCVELSGDDNEMKAKAPILRSRFRIARKAISYQFYQLENMTDE
jgi:hypothetical protein